MPCRHRNLPDANRSGRRQPLSDTARIVEVAHGDLTPARLAQVDAIFFEASGRSFPSAGEAAAFRERWPGRYLEGGLYQPPSGLGRVYLSELRYRQRVRLQSVGGTVLLVDAGLHRAGLLFPERPYRHLIETEAFAKLAGELGVESLGLPWLEVLHAENG